LGRIWLSFRGEEGFVGGWVDVRFVGLRGKGGRGVVEGLGCGCCEGERGEEKDGEHGVYIVISYS
jgi:hypothetical protein